MVQAYLCTRVEHVPLHVYGRPDVDIECLLLAFPTLSICLSVYLSVYLSKCQSLSLKWEFDGSDRFANYKDPLVFTPQHWNDRHGKRSH